MLELVIGGVTLSLSHVGSGLVIVRDQCRPIPAETEGVIRISVNDRLRTRKVFFPHGIPGPDTVAHYL